MNLSTVVCAPMETTVDESHMDIITLLHTFTHTPAINYVCIYIQYIMYMYDVYIVLNGIDRDCKWLRLIGRPDQM